MQLSISIIKFSERELKPEEKVNVIYIYLGRKVEKCNEVSQVETAMFVRYCKQINENLELLLRMSPNFICVEAMESLMNNDGNKNEFLYL